MRSGWKKEKIFTSKQNDFLTVLLRKNNVLPLRGLLKPDGVAYVTATSEDVMSSDMKLDMISMTPIV